MSQRFLRRQIYMLLKYNLLIDFDVVLWINHVSVVVQDIQVCAEG